MRVCRRCASKVSSQTFVSLEKDEEILSVLQEPLLPPVEYSRRILVCVPARYGSTRLPGKLLEQIGKYTIIEHVCFRLHELNELIRLDPDFSSMQVTFHVLTDHPEIFEKVLQQNIPAVFSKHAHETGTSRIQEFVEKEDLLNADDLIVNVQGDEPFVSVQDIFKLLKGFRIANANAFPMGTLAHKNTCFADFLDPSCVKIVLGNDNRALYFSRAPIPWPRSLLGTLPLDERVLAAPKDLPVDWYFWQHLGIYVYRASFLLSYHKEVKRNEVQNLQPFADTMPIDTIEGLEQLAALKNGRNIWVAEALSQSKGIDTPRDLEMVRKQFQAD